MEKRRCGIQVAPVLRSTWHLVSHIVYQLLTYPVTGISYSYGITGYSIACQYLIHYTRHYHFMFMTTVPWIRDIDISCARSPSHGHSNALNTLDTVISWCSMYMPYSYIDTENHDIITACSWTTDTLKWYYTRYRHMDTLCTVTSCPYTIVI